jgi:UDP-N-acetylglucosamine--N-acetylmuramyl-(pentapeptide) pyrophosphoryl-undecaprenol N-acetylglucosamine transferase
MVGSALGVDEDEASFRMIEASVLSRKVRSNSPRRRVAIVGGGTAGHVYPALAFGDAYRRLLGEEVEILFIGTSEGFEARLLPKSGEHVELVPGSPFFGVGMRGKTRALLSTIAGLSAARHLLKQKQIQLVVGFGGYASAGALLAAKAIGLRTAIHESNIVPGLTNRALGRIVDRVYLGFEEGRRGFPVRRAVVTGIPVRESVLRAAQARRTPLRSRPARILVTGGSQGSSFLNERAPELMHELCERGVDIQVRHQAGENGCTLVREGYAQVETDAEVTSYIDDMAEAFAWADFAICCSGAGTLAELAACGLPSLLVPLAGSTRDHQAANAKVFATATGGWWVREEDWNAEALARQIMPLLTDDAAWRDFSERARRLSKPDAARALVADCEEALRSVH